MKRIWIVLLALLFLAFCAFLWLLPAFLLGFMWGASEPGCDEGPVTDRSSTNGRGDVVEEYTNICGSIGSIIDYSIVLQLKGDEKMTTLATHEWLLYDYPQFTWINDDELNIALGNVAWVSHKVEKVGSIRITYSYTKTGWW